MTPIRYAACAVALGFLAPAWAINKCTGADGKVSFQDAPCTGQGEKIDVRPAIEGVNPAQPSPSAVQEGVFGESWQRKNFLQTQGVPQARAAVARSQQECEEQQRLLAQQRPLPRHLASGSQFAQGLQAEAQKVKAACDARTEDLRGQLQALEKELSGLQ